MSAGRPSPLRRLLTHSSGLADQRFYDPENKFRFNLEPGSRYAYSNEGINLLQFVIEESLGLKVGDEMNRRLFQPLGMTRSSMIWRDDFKEQPGRRLSRGRQVGGP
jgi:CubicO group peptidase (beta-lactamase class C family)